MQTTDEDLEVKAAELRAAGWTVTPPARDDDEPSSPPWTHGSRLGREHRSTRQHLIEDHGVSPDQVAAWSDGAIHGHHDGVHRETWAYAYDLVHPAPGDRKYLENPT